MSAQGWRSRLTGWTRHGERGATIVEYALILALVSVVAASSAAVFADSLAGLFGDTATVIADSPRSHPGNPGGGGGNGRGNNGVGNGNGGPNGSGPGQTNNGG